jgi:hypothetical protein
MSGKMNDDSENKSLTMLQRRAQRLVAKKTIKSIKFFSPTELMITLEDNMRLYVESDTPLDISITSGV